MLEDLASLSSQCEQLELSVRQRDARHENDAKEVEKVTHAASEAERKLALAKDEVRFYPFLALRSCSQNR